MIPTLAIIPARGGSKRLPGKNIRSFCGKPIIAYSIIAALESKLFTEVMVSTDSIEIAEVAKSYGAKVPFLRSSENSDDYATTADVLLEVLETYQAKGNSFGKACCIYPTAPFVTAKKLIEGMELMTEGNFDVVYGICAYSFPIYRSFSIEAGKSLRPNWPENMSKRSQDLPKAYHDAGQFYWFDTTKLTATCSLISNNIGGIELNEMEVQDIDNETDWHLAELKFKMMHVS